MNQTVWDFIAYALIQPKLKTDLEYKVVLLNGKAITQFKKKPDNPPVFMNSDMTECYLFPDESLRQQQLMRPCRHGTIDHGFIRVNILLNNDVNEFKSLDALHSTNAKNNIL